MAEIFHQLGALSEPIRTRIVALVEVEELSVGELVRVLALPQSTVSRHLKRLLDDDWVVRRREGSGSWFALADLPVARRRLWQVVADGIDQDASFVEDARRLKTVLEEREVASEAYFARMAERWDGVRTGLFGQEFLGTALAALGSSGLRVADLGCGPGTTLSLLAPVAKRVIGIDREPSMIAAAASITAHSDNVELRCGRVEELPLGEGEVDLVLLTLLLHHLEHPADVVEQAARALDAGGRLLLVDMLPHEREEYRRTMGHRHLGFSRETVERWASCAGMQVSSFSRMPMPGDASGPPLFVAVLS
ncbi:MAG: ArsR/SmtB family transcription factor [Myxococcota bacterium]